MKRIWFVVALALLSPRTADACRCVEPPLGEAAKRAKFVFSGTITKITKTSKCHPRHRDWCSHTFTYEVAVDRVWKGDVAASVVVVSDPKLPCHRGALRNAKRWLFTVRSHDAGFALRLCDGTRPTTDAGAEVLTRVLGMPRGPS